MPKTALQVEEQDRKFGSHHHQRLRVTYRTASMGGSSVCPVLRRCRVSSAGSRWEIQFAPSTKCACDVQPSQCYGDHHIGLLCNGPSSKWSNEVGFSVRIANKAYRSRAARPARRGDQAPAASSNSGAAEVSSVARRDEHELSCGRCTSSAPHGLPTCRLKTCSNSGTVPETALSSGGTG